MNKISEERKAEMIRFINKHYANAESPMRQREIAKVFNVTESVISKLVVENDLQRKHDFKELVIKKGVSEKVTRRKLKMPFSKEQKERIKRLNCVDCVEYRKCMFLSCPFE